MKVNRLALTCLRDMICDQPTAYNLEGGNKMKHIGKASDQELNILIDLYKEYETIQEKVIYEVAVELKSYRDLKRCGSLVELPRAAGREEEVE